jgi:acetoacetyl-CoA reductase/3-oxoacyl-[acyl-carrier protein] reductase
MSQLVNKVALVTGGSRGIGKGISVALSKVGVAVALTYNTNRILAEQVVKDTLGKGGRAMAVQLKVEDRESVRQTLMKVRNSFGPVSILVNNAAIAQEKPFDTITNDDWNHMMAINLRGPFTCCQEVLPAMLKQGWGRIINISSIGGQWGGYNQVHYAAAKAGLINLTHSLARIYSKDGITFNAIAPGLVGTNMAQNELNIKAGREKVRNIPIGRVATPEEVANVVVFLASDGASYITGQTINVNGGMYFG